LLPSTRSPIFPALLRGADAPVAVRLSFLAHAAAQRGRYQAAEQTAAAQGAMIGETYRLPGAVAWRWATSVGMSKADLSFGPSVKADDLAPKDKGQHSIASVILANFLT
jgi:hypothetical protein